MQKKINILASLLVIAFILGGLSTCTRGSFRTGWESVRDNTPEFKFEPEINIVARDNFYPQTLVNTKTGEKIQVSMRSAMVGVNERPNDVAPESQREKVLEVVWFIVALVVAFGGLIAFVLLLFVLITSIKSGGIFLKGNEKTLRWMGAIMLAWYAVDLIESFRNYFFTKSLIALEDYKIIFEAPSFYPLVAGFTFLLFAQIFAKGRKMEEDQEFMV